MRSFEVMSPQFNHGAPMSTRYAHQITGGPDVSPPLQLDAFPDETQSLAFALIDKNAHDFVHWMVVNLPAEEPLRIDEGASGHAMPQGARELYDSAQVKGYYGPNPPSRTGEHRYELRAYALDTDHVDLDEHASLKAFEREMNDHAVAEGSTYWVYAH